MHECRNTLCFPNLPVNSSSSCQKFPNLDVIYQEIVPILVWLERLEIGRFLRHMALLFSFHERSDGCGEQKTLSRLKKRAKIIVSNLSPADE
jgi:hypothetical protein